MSRYVECGMYMPPMVDTSNEQSNVTVACPVAPSIAAGCHGARSVCGGIVVEAGRRGLCAYLAVMWRVVTTRARAR